MKRKFNLFISSFVVALALAIPQLSYGSDESQDEIIFSPEIIYKIVKEAAVGQTLNDIPLTNLALVCDYWHWIIKDEKQIGKDLWKELKTLNGVETLEDEGIYHAFLNGVLVYRPNLVNDHELAFRHKPDYDNGMITLKISDFLNPFKGTFDLSECGSANSFLTITTDPSVFFHVIPIEPIEEDNINSISRVIVLFATHFFIQKHLTDTTIHFKDIMANWDKDKAPVGIFWRLADCKTLPLCDYRTSLPLTTISFNNLFENWRNALRVGENICGGAVGKSRNFHINFANQNSNYHINQ